MKVNRLFSYNTVNIFRLLQFNLFGKVNAFKLSIRSMLNVVFGSLLKRCKSKSVDMNNLADEHQNKGQKCFIMFVRLCVCHIKCFKISPASNSFRYVNYWIDMMFCWNIAKTKIEAVKIFRFVFVYWMIMPIPTESICSQNVMFKWVISSAASEIDLEIVSWVIS